MTARLPSSNSKPAPAADGVGTTPVSSAHAQIQTTPRVVSLSPAAAGIEMKPLPMTAPMSESLITPSPTDLEPPLTAQAQTESMERLQELLNQLTELEPSAQTASASLHERLRLGARMLQAFSVQLNRVEGALANIASRRADLDSILTSIQSTHETLRRQSDQATSQAAERIESAAAQAVVRVQAAGPGSPIGSLTDRIGALESRLRALEERAGATASDASPPPARHIESEIRKEIGELAGAMRDLADRVGQIVHLDEPPQSSIVAAAVESPDHAPLRFKKWAGHR